MIVDQQGDKQQAVADNLATWQQWQTTGTVYPSLAKPPTMNI
jgi:hypothetical protein